LILEDIDQQVLDPHPNKFSQYILLMLKWEWMISWMIL